MTLAQVSRDTPLLWILHGESWPTRHIPGPGLLLRIVSLHPPVFPRGTPGVVQWATPDGLRQQPVRVRQLHPTAVEVSLDGPPHLLHNRAVPRLRLAVPLLVGLTRADWPAYTSDLSLLGASFLSPVQLRVGDAIVLTLRLSTGSVPLRATVARVVPEAAGWRVGVHWPADDAPQYDALREALTHAQIASR